MTQNNSDNSAYQEMKQNQSHIASESVAQDEAESQQSNEAIPQQAQAKVEAG